MITVWVDGSCYPNPGPGGWACVILSGGKRSELSGGSPATTISRMELAAAIVGIFCTPSGSEVKLVTDSQYVQGVIQGSFKRIKKNQDQVQDLVDLCSRRRVAVEWVRGHTGLPENERCDWLAAEQRRKYSEQKTEGRSE